MTRSSSPDGPAISRRSSASRASYFPWRPRSRGGFAFVELLAFAERFFVVEPLPAEPALRLDFAVAAFREPAFGLPAPPDPFAEVREAALLALLPFELERFLVALELERFVLV